MDADAEDAISRSHLIRRLIQKRNVLYNMQQGSVYSATTDARISVRLKAINDVIGIVRNTPSKYENR